jgi:hypothetical protein
MFPPALRRLLEHAATCRELGAVCRISHVSPRYSTWLPLLYRASVLGALPGMDGDVASGGDGASGAEAAGGTGTIAELAPLAVAEFQPIAESYGKRKITVSAAAGRPSGITRILVRTAMAARTRVQARYLAGRPPRRYRLANARSHLDKARRAHAAAVPNVRNVRM